MSEPGFDDEELRAAFQSAPSPDDSDPDLADELWAAARGELDPERRRELVARCATDAAFAEQWRLTFALARDAGELASQEDQARVEPAANDGGRGIWWLSGAAIAAAAAVALLVLPDSRTPVPREDDSAGQTIPPVLRAGETFEILPTPDDDSELPRSEFTLEWAGAPEGSNYELVVEHEDTSRITTRPSLSEARYTVPPELLEDVPAGTVIHWRVSAVTPEGVRVDSPTFRARLK